MTDDAEDDRPREQKATPEGLVLSAVAADTKANPPDLQEIRNFAFELAGRYERSEAIWISTAMRQQPLPSVVRDISILNRLVEFMDLVIADRDEVVDLLRRRSRMRQQQARRNG